MKNQKPESRRYEWDKNGNVIACTYRGDTKNPKSWRKKQDKNGETIACTYGNDPHYYRFTKIEYVA